MSEIKAVIEELRLEPHPEGGFFRETYRSSLLLSGLKEFSGDRACSTGIFFLLTRDSKSHLHRIRSDEMWHFYKGDPLRIHMLNEQGEHSQVVLGGELGQHQKLQFVVPAGVWFGAEVIDGGSYSLVGCTVAPGFDFSDFEIAEGKALEQRFPQHRKFLSEFCLKSN